MFPIMIAIMELVKFIPIDIGMKPNAKSAMVRFAANQRLKSDLGRPRLDSVGIRCIPMLSSDTYEHVFVL